MQTEDNLQTGECSGYSVAYFYSELIDYRIIIQKLIFIHIICYNMLISIELFAAIFSLHVNAFLLFREENGDYFSTGKYGIVFLNKSILVFKRFGHE